MPIVGPLLAPLLRLSDDYYLVANQRADPGEELPLFQFPQGQGRDKAARKAVEEDHGANRTDEQKNIGQVREIGGGHLPHSLPKGICRKTRGVYTDSVQKITDEDEHRDNDWTFYTGADRVPYQQQQRNYEAAEEA